MDERILDYGIPPLHHRRIYRRLLAATLLLGVVAAIYFVGPSAWRWCQYFYWQQECLDYSAPANLAIYDSTAGVNQVALCLPEAQFWRMGSGYGAPPPVAIFVHGMSRPDGTKCLVELNLLATSPPMVWDKPLALIHFSLGYGVWTVSPAARLARTGFSNFQDITRLDKWKIYAGRPDPADPSHFTFDFELSGRRHTCDAWLNNSNQIVLSTRP